jgi:hypothetical protein
MDFDEHEWVKLYRAALLEFDEAKLDEKIVSAQNAIDRRIQELTAYSLNHHEERRALADAGNGLRVLRCDSTRKPKA